MRLFELALVTGAYALVDLAMRQDALAGLGRVAGARRRAPWVFAIPWLVLANWWSWSSIPSGRSFQVLCTVVVAGLAWKASTKDIDIVVGSSEASARLAVVAAAVGTAFSPALLFVAAYFLNRPFGLWQHHATLPMRVLQALMAFLLLAELSQLGIAAEWPPLTSPATAVFFVATIQVSHYLITALAKALLGPRWYSWVTDNRLHHLAASAYSWGWARFLPWSTWRRFIGALKVIERPMQLAAFSIELAAPLALLDPRLAIGFCLGWSAFHLGVFLCSGLLFWDWMLTNVAIAVAIALMPEAVTDVAFGPIPTLAGVLFMLIFPLRHKLWKPMPLGWYDTPFTQRIHWRVEGASGATYGLYNDFMCPHERLYGKVHGCFLAPVPVMTYHLGEVWKPDLRDALREAGPDLGALASVREAYGIDPRDEAMATRHEVYLRNFFGALEQGRRKRVLPRGLRWLKAPGGQLFHWGELPSFTGQEEAIRVTLHYREEYFDGEELRRLMDEEVMAIDLRQPCPAPVRELTPKEMDDFLLPLAEGRLIDLPELGRGYVQADDGKVDAV